MTALRPTHSLCLGLFHRWRPDKLFVIFTAYFDESGTHDQEAVTLMAGHVARSGQWDVLDRKWRKILRRKKLSHIHSKDLVHGAGECKGWHYKDRDLLIKKISKIIQKHTLFSIVAVINDEDYNKYYIADNRPKKIQLDSKYGLCFRLCLSFLVEKIREVLPNEEIELHIILEDGHKNAGDALRLYQVFRKHGKPEHVEMVKTLIFGEKKKYPGLQAADQCAYGALQQERRQPVEVHEFPREKSQELPRKKVRTFRLHGDEAVLTELKDNILSTIAARKAHWEAGGELKAEIDE